MTTETDAIHDAHTEEELIARMDAQIEADRLSEHATNGRRAQAAADEANAQALATPLRVFHVLGLYKPMWFATVDGMVSVLVAQARTGGYHAHTWAVQQLAAWAEQAQPGAMLDGWYAATWVFVLDGNALDEAGHRCEYELEDEPTDRAAQ